MRGNSKSEFSEMTTIHHHHRKSLEAITGVRTRKSAYYSVAVEVANKIAAAAIHGAGVYLGLLCLEKTQLDKNMIKL